MATKAANRRTAVRSAKSGRFVDAGTAQLDPAGTVTEEFGVWRMFRLGGNVHIATPGGAVIILPAWVIRRAARAGADPAVLVARA